VVVGQLSPRWISRELVRWCSTGAEIPISIHASSRRACHSRYAPAAVWTCLAHLPSSYYTLHLLGTPGRPSLATLLRRGAVVPALDLADELDRVLSLMQRYTDIPMSLADACLVRMSEILADPLIFTTDADFRVYRRHSRHVVPCITPY
jgi:hypothetical protein